MSRSKKSRAILTQDKKDKKKYKRLANKRVRKTEDLSDGKVYKEVSQSWDICDWKIDYTGDEQEDIAKRK